MILYLDSIEISESEDSSQRATTFHGRLYNGKSIALTASTSDLRALLVRVQIIDFRDNSVVYVLPPSQGIISVFYGDEPAVVLAPLDTWEFQVGAVVEPVLASTRERPAILDGVYRYRVVVEQANVGLFLPIRTDPNATVKLSLVRHR